MVDSFHIVESLRDAWFISTCLPGFLTILAWTLDYFALIGLSSSNV